MHPRVDTGQMPPKGISGYPLSSLQTACDALNLDLLGTLLFPRRAAAPGIVVTWRLAVHVLLPLVSPGLRFPLRLSLVRGLLDRVPRPLHLGGLVLDPPPRPRGVGAELAAADL